MLLGENALQIAGLWKTDQKELLLQDDIPHYSDPDDCDMCRYLINHNEMKNI